MRRWSRCGRLPEPDGTRPRRHRCCAAIEATTDPAVAEEDIEALDQQFLDSPRLLGVSDECIGGPQG